jgi:hypothetical protein
MPVKVYCIIIVDKEHSARILDKRYPLFYSYCHASR